VLIRDLSVLVRVCWAIVVLAVMTAGCAVCEKTTPKETCPFDKLRAGSEQSRRIRNSAPRLRGDRLAPAEAEGGGASADKDFDLLEEEVTSQMAEVADPLEPLNRLMFGVNDILYFWVVKPCAQLCKDVVPEPARLGVRNFFRNLATPIRLANCLLQGKGDSAGTELHRFLVNTTAGVLGFGDPARDKLGLEPADEDLGQTLAVYGLGDGFYILLPLLGPSTLRDTAGYVGDQFLNPLWYVEPTEVSIGISSGKIVNESSFHIGEYEAFKSAAVDPYVAMREAYIQYRNNQIQQ